MKCTNCGYTDHMTKFARASNSLSCCSGTHLRRCPKCNKPSPCNPLMEEVYEEKMKQQIQIDENS